MSPSARGAAPTTIVPTGELLHLRPDDVKPNITNPRMLFDPEPLDDLKENIRLHGVLVPITVFRLAGSDRYGILDGARRYACCVELEAEGMQLTIPANIVQPPDRLAGLLYMFSIHNFREQWELMPTALSLKIVMEELGEGDSKKLAHVTGLSEPQVDRCKVLLDVPERFQQLSLDPNPKTRIPSNFWIEARPVVELVASDLPDVYARIGREGVLDAFVAKYRSKPKRIKSVIHFRRIVEAFSISEDDPALRERVAHKLRGFVVDPKLETRAAFDEFILDNRQVQSALRACETFIAQIERASVTHAIDTDREELLSALRRVLRFTEQIITRMEGSDPPPGDEAAEDPDLGVD